MGVKSRSVRRERTQLPQVFGAACWRGFLSDSEFILEILGTEGVKKDWCSGGDIKTNVPATRADTTVWNPNVNRMKDSKNTPSSMGCSTGMVGESAGLLSPAHNT
jgi:hypothetical protein